jgi:hypothetical protein
MDLEEIEGRDDSASEGQHQFDLPTVPEQSSGGLQLLSSELEVSASQCTQSTL